MRVTSDDLVVAVGHLSELSLATMVCHAWCGGTSLALVPCDLVSAVLAGVTPQGLAVGGTPDMLQQDGSARFEICDLDLIGLSERRTRLPRERPSRPRAHGRHGHGGLL